MGELEVSDADGQLYFIFFLALGLCRSGLLPVTLGQLLLCSQPARIEMTKKKRERERLFPQRLSNNCVTTRRPGIPKAHRKGEKSCETDSPQGNMSSDTI